MPLTAINVGFDADKVGPENSLVPDGRADHHFKVTGLAAGKPIARRRIDATNNLYVAETPHNGVNWNFLAESDGAGGEDWYTAVWNGEIPAQQWRVTVTYTDGSNDAGLVLGNPVQPPVPTGGVILAALPPNPGNGSIVGQMIINTDTYPATPTTVPAPVVHQVEWSYAGTVPFHILFSRIWHGIDNGSYADINAFAELWRTVSGVPRLVSLINMFPFDRYALPGAPNFSDVPYAPPGLILQPGDSIRFFYYARSAVAGNNTFNAAHTCYLWGSYT